MARTREAEEYILAVNLQRGADTRRFCQVVVRRNDIYVFQPGKGGGQVKFSYHASGQRHYKIGQANPQGVRYDMPPASLRTSKRIWSKSFENFDNLLPWTGGPADDVCNLKLPDELHDPLPFVEMHIGSAFGPTRWVQNGVLCETLEQQVFPIPWSQTGLMVCMNLLRMRQP
jgi:hypothetical protein